MNVKEYANELAKVVEHVLEKKVTVVRLPRTNAEYYGISIERDKDVEITYTVTPLFENKIYLPQGIKVFECFSVPDGQLILDSSMLNVVCRMLSLRWGVTKIKKGSGEPAKAFSQGYFGLAFQQINFSEYVIYLPSGDAVAWVCTPPDNQYLKDSLTLSYMCRAISLRYGVTN